MADPHAFLREAPLLWDTAVHSTIIVDELLPQDFQEYLKNPVNNCYRSAGGTPVRIDALIAFTNRSLELNCMCRRSTLRSSTGSSGNYFGLKLGD